MKKVSSRRYPTETMTDVNYSDDWSLLANISPQTESLLYSQEQAAGGLRGNVNKTESKISRAVHILQGQHLIYWKWCQHTAGDGVECNQELRGNMEI